MPNYAPRITLPYNDVSGVVNAWKGVCEYLAVYEHPADDKVSSTHVHLLMLNCKFKTPQQLKNIFRKHVDTDRDGNELWKWTSKYGEPDKNFLIYMAKGKYYPKDSKGFDQEDFEWAIKMWRGLPVREKRVKPTGEVIPAKQEKVKQLTKFELLTAMKHELEVFKQNHPTWLVTKTHRNKIVVQVLKEYKQVFGLYKAIDFSYALQMYDDEDSYVDSMDAAMKF